MPEAVPQADRGRLVVDAEDDDEKKKKSSLVDSGSNRIEKSGFAKFLKNLKLWPCLLEMGFVRELVRDNLSEWLRRQTRNLLGFARAGSNPAVVVFLFLLSSFYLTFLDSFKIPNVKRARI